MRIRWHGHACFEVEDKVAIVTDPHDGRSIGIRPPVVTADLVLVSHEHFDHNCARVVKGDPKVVNVLGETIEKGVKIVGIETYHDDAMGEKRGTNTVYKFTMGGIDFCHLGDLGHVLLEETVREIGKIDILFIPVGDVFTINGEKAWSVVNQLKPRVVIPMHYRIGGLSLSIKPVDEFLDNISGEKIVKVGNEIEFEKEDLPKELETWVFTL